MIFILTAMLFYTIAIMVGAIASRNADTSLVNAIVNSISAIIPIGLVATIMARAGTLQNSKIGILAAIITGIAITLFGLALTKSYTTNKVAIVAPIVFGGSIFLSAILSTIFFKERITTLQLIGLIFMGIGLACIIYTKATNS